MKTNFKITGLDKNEFYNFFDLSELELKNIGVMRMIVDKNPGFPCRVSLEDAKIGEEVILLNYNHHRTDSPYKSNGPIFVRKIAETKDFNTNEIPKMLNHRLLSLRGYDKNGIMIAAKVAEGKILNEELNLTFEDSNIAYIHIHNAKPGCYNCKVERELN